MTLRRLFIAFVSAVFCLYSNAAGLGHCACPGFGWGADIGTSIDVSGHDMSTINIDAYCGYTGGAISMAGVGAGAHMMMANSARSFPIYGILRSGFSPEPTLCFMDLRVGIAVNNLPHGGTKTAPYIAPSLGFTLARGLSFDSYLLLGYTFNGMRSFGPEDNRTVIPGGVHMVSATIGIAF